MPRKHCLRFCAVFLFSLALAGLLSGLVRSDSVAVKVSRSIPLTEARDSMTEGSLNAFGADGSEGFDQKLAGTERATSAHLSEAYGKLSLSFEANHGQTDRRVKFLSRGTGYDLFLTSNEAVVSLRAPSAQKSTRRESTIADKRAQSRAAERQRAVIRIKPVGANAKPNVTAHEMLPGRVNYLVGKDAREWQTDIPTFARVKYENVYSGVDMVYYGNQRQLEYDFIVAPFAQPEKIKLSFDGIRKMRLDERGDLVLSTEAGEVRQYRPVIYQEVDGLRREIAGGYVLKGKREIGFRVAEYDASRPLIIDPVLAYSTFLGGHAYDTGIGIDVDANGNAYVTGYTASADFPLAQPLQSQKKLLTDAFVTKLNANGSALLYSTYLGGDDDDRGDGITLDANGNAHLKGHTKSSNFPTTPGAFDTTYNGVSDAFVTKLSADGNALLYSTYLGGSDNEDDFGDFREGGIALDASGNAYVSGHTFSNNFPTLNAVQPLRANSASNAYVTKLNPTGSALLYSTYFYPNQALSGLHGTDIAVDAAGSAYLGSTDGSAAFVTKFNPAGSAIIYSNHYAGDDGGGIRAEGVAIAVDASGNAYLTGATTSFTFPITPNAYQTRKAGSHDIFVLKVNAAGSALVYSTFLGGFKDEKGGDIDVDEAGNAYITGHTDGSGGYCSQGFPLVDPLPGSPGANCSFPDKGVVATKVNASGSTLLFSTVIGPGDGKGIAVDSGGGLYVTGWTDRPSFPTTAGAFQTSLAEDYMTDAFVSKISVTASTPQFFIIRGRLVGNQGPVFQATVTLSGSQSRTTMTDFDGYYTFRSLPIGGTYTVAPAKTDYTFAPESRTFRNLNDNQTADFTGTTAQQNAVPTAYPTSPSPQQTYTAPANITVSAYAEDYDGVVTKVEFYANSTLIGTDTTAPFSIIWANVAPGNYNLTVIATDNQGATGGGMGYVPITVQQSLLNVITGRITNEAGVGFSGVSVTLSGAQGRTTTTDAYGNYSFAGLVGGSSYTVTPHRPNYSFSPSSLTFSNLSGSQTGTIVGAARSTIRRADFDGDGRTDVSVWQSDSGKWHVLHSADPGVTLQFWGQSSLGDSAVPADYDGDGLTDIAIFRHSEGNWYILRSTNGAPTVFGWGQQNDRPVPADYDGDGVTDLAVYRPSDGNWYIKQSSGGSQVQGWGNATDKLLPADYDGDGKADIAVFRPSDGNWYIRKSTGGVLQQNWGIGSDRPVPADYDGDGITDLAVYRPGEGNWYIIKSSGGSIVRNWGASADRPVPADYDGDGRADLAVWRPGEATWYIIQSATNSSAVRFLGSSADLPLPAAALE